MPAPSTRPARPPLASLGDAEIEELQGRLDAVPAPLEPLDVSMLDGFLCGVLVQPKPVARARWLPHVTDIEGRSLPARFDAARLHELVLRRHAELDDAVTRRRWFDPWVFELEGADDEEDASPAVVAWAAGFAMAVETFPALLGCDPHAISAPLALVYRCVAPDNLEDADELLDEIDALEPPADLNEAVESLVRATLLLADVTRPIRPPGRRPPAARRR